MPSRVPPQLADVLADPDDRRLAESILGTADGAAIQAALGAFCRERLGSAVADVMFCAFSVGAGFGLVLGDGRRVFLKAWSVATAAESLAAAHVVQSALAARGFPAPAVLVAPAPFMAGHASVMDWLGRGAEADAHHPPHRRAMAQSLARLITLAEPYAGLRGLPRHTYPDHAVWGPTHNALFDFAATARGAGWIDEIGAASAEEARAGEGRLVVGHRDWSVKNLRFTAGHSGVPQVSAVYDWDALAVAREPEIVGMAAAAFTVTWTVPIARMLPTPAEMVAFIRDYEAAGRPFTAAEWRTAAAAATYLLAYTARCEHCTGPRDDPGSAQALLREATSGGRRTVFAAPEPLA